MDIFKQSKIDRIQQIVDHQNSRNLRTFIFFTVKLPNTDSEELVMIPTVEISPMLTGSINRSGGLLLSVGRQACPDFHIADGYVMGSMTVQKVACSFKIPVDLISFVKDPDCENAAAHFELDFSFLEKLQQEAEPERPKSGLRLVQ